MSADFNGGTSSREGSMSGLHSEPLPFSDVERPYCYLFHHTNFNSGDKRIDKQVIT